MEPNKFQQSNNNLNNFKSNSTNKIQLNKIDYIPLINNLSRAIKEYSTNTVKLLNSNIKYFENLNNSEKLNEMKTLKNYLNNFYDSAKKIFKDMKELKNKENLLMSSNNNNHFNNFNNNFNKYNSNTHQIFSTRRNSPSNYVKNLLKNSDFQIKNNYYTNNKDFESEKIKLLNQQISNLNEELSKKRTVIEILTNRNKKSFTPPAFRTPNVEKVDLNNNLNSNEMKILKLVNAKLKNKNINLINEINKILTNNSELIN